MLFSRLSLLSRAKPLISTGLRFNSAIVKPKRFYKDVSVIDEETNDGKKLYSVLLDNRVLKTVGGNVLKIESEPLALTIAQEWDSQKDVINKTVMRLTGLTFTAIDNPFNETKESLTTQIMNFLETDTLLYYASNPDNLIKLQNERWGPVLQWINSAFELNIKPTHSIIDLPDIAEGDSKKIERWLMSNNFWSLIGIQYGVEAAKSILATLYLLGGQASVENVTELARLEQIYQTQVWGNVEWCHDFDHQELNARLAACLLFYHFVSNSHVVKSVASASSTG